MAQFISSDAIISRIYRVFKPNDADWTVDVYESIKTALQLIGHEKLFCDGMEEVCIKNYRGKLPCRFSAVLGIEVDGCRFTPESAVTYDNNSLIICDDNANTYKLSGNIISAPFKEGKMNVYFNALRKGIDGKPMVPDEASCMIFISYYCMFEMLASGYQHPNITYKELRQEVEIWQPRAANALTFETAEEMEKFKNNRDIVHFDDYFQDRFFNTRG